MISKRDALFGGICVAGAGLTASLKPRRRVSLLGGKRLAAILPARVGSWNSRDVTDLVDTGEKDSLMDRLYGQTVERVYRNTTTGDEIMMLFAYGDSQTNDLQLHRPEICYPSFGLQVTQTSSTKIMLNNGVGVPARFLVANGPGRKEIVLYWSRLGEYLPVNGAEQRVDRLRTAMSGTITDGLLARLSMIKEDVDAAVRIQQDFGRALIGAVQPGDRAALIGTALAAV